MGVNLLQSQIMMMSATANVEPSKINKYIYRHHFYFISQIDTNNMLTGQKMCTREVIRLALGSTLSLSAKHFTLTTGIALAACSLDVQCLHRHYINCSCCVLCPHWINDKGKYRPLINVYFCHGSVLICCHTIRFYEMLG